MPILPFDERLEQLLAAAARVFAEKGYHATTMRDLSRASGLSLAGMYHYVAGKEELLYLIQRRCFEQVFAGAQAALAGEPDPEAQIRAFIRHHVAFFTAHMAEMKVLSHEADSLTGERDAEIRQLKKRYARLLADSIAGLDGPDAPVAAYGLFGMMNWIYTWYRPDGRVAPNALADLFAHVFLHGASPAGETGTAASTTQSGAHERRSV